MNLLLLIFFQFKFQKFEASSVMNTLYSKFKRLKANFVMSCTQNALKSLENRSNFVLEKSGNHSQISVRTL